MNMFTLGTELVGSYFLQQRLKCLTKIFLFPPSHSMSKSKQCSSLLGRLHNACLSQAVASVLSPYVNLIICQALTHTSHFLFSFPLFCNLLSPQILLSVFSQTIHSSLQPFKPLSCLVCVALPPYT